MIGLIEAEERPGGRRAGLERDSPRLQSRAGRLELKALRREARPEWDGEPIGVTVGGAHHLAKIGGEVRRAFQTAVRGPWMRSALRQILPAHQNKDPAPMARDVMVRVLAGVGLVVHEKARIAKPEILDEDGVAGDVRFAIVDDLDAPEPGVQARMQPERDPMPDAGSPLPPRHSGRPRRLREALPRDRSRAESPAHLRLGADRGVPCH